MIEDKILGALYGMAYGDSFAMPGELWPRSTIKKQLGTITEFLDGPENNEVSKWFKKGEFTDDTGQAIVILKNLIKNKGNIDRISILQDLLVWAEEHDAFSHKFFGPSSEAVLRAAREGKESEHLTLNSETNGAAMRIAPIGCLFKAKDKAKLTKFVANVSKCTHGTDVAISGAALIAGAVTKALDNASWDEIVNYAYEIADIARQYGKETYNPSISQRAILAVSFAQQLSGKDEEFMQTIYDVIGTGVITSESIPAALAIAYYSKTPDKCAFICANLGGDTDTIAAMATAICGAKCGISSISNEVIDLINEKNKVDFRPYVKDIMDLRAILE